MLPLARARRRDARAAAPRDVRRARAVLDRLGLDPRPTRRVPAGAHIALVPTMLRRLRGRGRRPLAVRDPPGRRRRARRRSGGAGGAAAAAASCRRTGSRRPAAASPTTGGPSTACGRGSRADGGIELRGPTLMEGYRHDPAATAAAFTLDGWLRTGDAGELEADGRLRVHGRSDEAIRTGRRDRMAAGGRGRAARPSEGGGRRRRRPAAPGVGTSRSWRSWCPWRSTIRPASRSSARMPRSGSRGSRPRGRSCW